MTISSRFVSDEKKKYFYYYYYYYRRNCYLKSIEMPLIRMIFTRSFDSVAQVQVTHKYSSQVCWLFSDGYFYIVI